jgi:hypothetical protein
MRLCLTTLKVRVNCLLMERKRIVKGRWLSFMSCYVWSKVR